MQVLGERVPHRVGGPADGPPGGADVVLSASDLARFVRCPHQTALDLDVALGRRPEPPEPLEAHLVRRRAHDHEAAYLARLRARGLEVHEVAEPPVPPGPGAWAERRRRTLTALADGADAVHGAVVAGGRWRVRAQVLLRRDDVPRGPGHDVVGTTLAPHPDRAAVAALALCGLVAAERSGVVPHDLVVVTADGAEHRHPFRDWAGPADRWRRELLAVVDAAAAGSGPTRPEPVPHCRRCRWREVCRADWEATDHLSLVAGMRPASAAVLREAGIDTVTRLAECDPDGLPSGLPAGTGPRLREQARLQLAARTGGPPPHRVLDPVPGQGFALLPEPSSGDVFFDIEGDPFVTADGLEYLFGVVHRGRYTGHWAVTADREQTAFESLVDHLVAAWQQDEGMHVYHYADYERLRLEQLSVRYRTRVCEVGRLLAGGRLVDLYAVLRGAVLVGTGSYSLKQLEALYWDRARAGDPVRDAMGSVLAFETWRRTGRREVLEDIRRYNERDCRSTEALRDWLVAVRARAGRGAGRGRDHRSLATPPGGESHDRPGSGGAVLGLPS